MDQRITLLNAADDIDVLLKKKLNAKGATPQARLRQVRRKLPGKIRRQASLVSDAAARLRKNAGTGLSNPGKVLAAHDAVIAHLDGINLEEIKVRKKIARRKWVQDLMTNYGIFLALLIGGYILIQQ